MWLVCDFCLHYVRSFLHYLPQVLWRQYPTITDASVFAVQPLDSLQMWRDLRWVSLIKFSVQSVFVHCLLDFMFSQAVKSRPPPLHPSYCCNASISYKGEYSYFNKATISNNDITLQTTNPCEKKALVSGSKGLIWDFSNLKSGYRDRE